MSKTSYHIAQANIATMRASLEDPIMRGFVSELDTINAVADKSAGFVWRLIGEGADATDVRLYEDDRILINMSTWESIEALQAFVYRSEHKELLSRRAEWFRAMERPISVLWWVRARERPTAPEAKRRLEVLDSLGPSPDAFTFKHRFPPPQRK